MPDWADCWIVLIICWLKIYNRNITKHNEIIIATPTHRKESYSWVLVPWSGKFSEALDLVLESHNRQLSYDPLKLLKLSCLRKTFESFWIVWNVEWWIWRKWAFVLQIGYLWAFGLNFKVNVDLCKFLEDGLSARSLRS